MSLRHILYNNEKPAYILLMFLTPIGIPPVHQRLDNIMQEELTYSWRGQIMQIYSGAKTTIIFPTAKAQTNTLEEILSLNSKMVGGLIRIDTSYP